jgi:hypothetical protein
VKSNVNTNMLCKELFNYQDKLYYINRKLKESQVNPDFVTELKEYWRCDMVLKQIQRQTNDVHFLFLVEIPDAEILEEETT